EDGKTIAQSNAKYDGKGNFIDERIKARYEGDFPMLEPEKLDFMDIAPNQIVSIAASMIPFLEHNDANRALMGSNMQLQAVPLLIADPPLVGTGIEDRVARDSGAAIVARRAGQVVAISADEIAVYSEEPLPEGETAKGDPKIDLYRLKKYLR